MSLSIFVTPDDKFEVEIGEAKFTLRPMSAREYLSKASMFSAFGKKMADGKVLDEAELDDMLQFLADQIISIAGVSKPVNKELLATLKPKFLYELISKVTAQMQLNNAEKSFR